MCLLSAATWFGADFLTSRSYSHPLVPYWNGLVGLGFYTIVALSVCALRASRRMQEETTRFIVHDLRSPLIALQMALDDLREIGPALKAEDRQHLLDIAAASTWRMMHMVNSLLDLGRLERGRMPVRPAEAQVAELVEASVGQIALWAAKYGVEIKRELAIEPATISVDADLTTRVLVNLLSNALIHSPTGSSIVLRFQRTTPDTVAFSVADEGPGVPEEWLDRIFDKFVQAEARERGASLGTGLGLAFCRLAVEAQGGRIRMENRPTKGVVVTFTLSIKVRARGA